VLGIPLVVITLGSVGAPASAQGDGGLRLGRTRIQPRIEVRSEYSDNAFLESSAEGPRGDLLTTFSPGLGADVALGRHVLRAEYRADVLRYNRFTRFHATHHRALARGRFRSPGERLELELANLYQDASLPPLTHRARRRGYREENAAGAFTVVPGDRSSIRVESSLLTRDFRRRVHRTDDFTIGEVGLKGFYRILPLTSALAHVRFRDTDNRPPHNRPPAPLFGPRAAPGVSPDSRATDYLVGLARPLGARLSGFLALGYGERRFEGGPFVADAVGEAELTFRRDRYTSATLSLGREIRDVRAFNETTGGGRYFVQTVATLEASHWLTRRIAGDISAGIGHRDFERRRRDWLYRAEVAVVYRPPRWLNFRAGYRYNATDTRGAGGPVDLTSFDANVVFLQVGFEL
jgi:hypothetical protein